MGSEQSKHNPCQIDQNQWIFEQQKIGHKIVKNRNTGQLGDQVIIFVDPQASIDKQLKIYNFRKENKDLGIVTILGAQLIENQRKQFCGNQRTMRVITEYIIKLWPSFPQLTLPQCIYALNESIVGFKTCFLQQGPFYVMGQMIGINQQGHIKVWLNQNFAYNHPLFQRPFLQITKDNNINHNSSEQQIVQQIIEIIQEKCQRGKFPSDLKSSLLAKQTFDEVHEQLQSYINKNSIYCIDKIHPNPNKMFKLEQQSLPDNTQQCVSPQRNQQYVTQTVSQYNRGSPDIQNRYTYHPIYERIKNQQRVQNTYINRPQSFNIQYEAKKSTPQVNTYKTPGIIIGPIQYQERYIPSKISLPYNLQVQPPFLLRMPNIYNNPPPKHYQANAIQINNNRVPNKNIAYQTGSKGLYQPDIKQKRIETGSYGMESSAVKLGFDGVPRFENRF